MTMLGRPLIISTSCETAVRTPAMKVGDLVYGFHESKGIVPLPAEEQVKGEPLLEEQGLHPVQRPICTVPATAFHAQVTQGRISLLIPAPPEGGLDIDRVYIDSILSSDTLSLLMNEASRFTNKATDTDINNNFNTDNDFNIDNDTSTYTRSNTNSTNDTFDSIINNNDSDATAALIEKDPVQDLCPMCGARPSQNPPSDKHGAPNAASIRKYRSVHSDRRTNPLCRRGT